MKLPIFMTLLITGSAALADLPSGMVFFTEDAACPTGSTPLADAGGRILAVAPAPQAVGRTIGQPISDTTGPVHSHSVGLALNLPSREVAGVSGGGNNNIAAEGNHTATADTDVSPSGLPFIALNVCVSE